MKQHRTISIPVPDALPNPDDLMILLNAIRTRFQPRAVWLFGSRARGGIAGNVMPRR